MREQKVSLLDRVVNKINGRIDFNHEFNQDHGRYIVRVKDIYSGKNPSLEFANKHEAIGGIFDDADRYSFIKGVKDSEGSFDVACYVAMDNIESAVGIARAKGLDYIIDAQQDKILKL